jgi:molybdate transport system ATP-binding protein
MSLTVSIRHAVPSFSLEADFETSGRLVALFGPSGCGKTSIVNVIAGLVKPRTARVVFDGQVLADTSNGIWLPAHQRQIGYVFQDARLLPHLSVRQNLRYGAWFTPQSKREVKEADILDLLDLASLLDQKPNQLSGGEKQRVALGRALLQSPRLLLMDEPLASLDEARKQEIVPYLLRLRDETRVPIVYVSHALAEVTRLATDMVLMSRGKVLAAGPLEKVMPELGDLAGELAQEAGAVISATVETFIPDDGLTVLHSAAGSIRLPGEVARRGSTVRLHVRAGDVALATARPEHISTLNILDGRVLSIVEAGESAMVSIRCGSVTLQARVTRHSVRMLGLCPEKQAYAIIKAMAVRSM